MHSACHLSICVCVFVCVPYILTHSESSEGDFLASGSEVVVAATSAETQLNEVIFGPNCVFPPLTSHGALLLLLLLLQCSHTLTQSVVQ